MTVYVWPPQKEIVKKIASQWYIINDDDEGKRLLQVV